MLESISNTGRKISDAEIKAFEKKNDVNLPESYVKFLLQNNGGTPSPNEFPLVGHREDATDVQVFYRLADGLEVSQLQYNYDFHQENLLGREFVYLFPIGTDSFGDPIYLDLSEERYGAVIFFDMVPIWKEHTAKDLYVIADSFSAFLEMLYEEDDED